MENEIHPLLRDVLAFCEQQKLARSTFGMLALNDPNFVDAMENRGREPRRKTVRRVRVFMANYVPPTPSAEQAQCEGASA